MGKCYFNHKWLQHENYSNWITEVKGQTQQAYCKLCKHVINLGSMGEHALISHANRKSHQSLIRLVGQTSRIGHYAVTGTSSSTSSTTPTPLSSGASSSTSTPTPLSGGASKSTSAHPPSASSSSINPHVLKNDTLKAEVIHCLKLINQHNSYKSSSDSGDMYRLMFPDSEIAKQFACGESKVRYLTTHGIGPYLKQQQLNFVKTLEWYVLFFDESLNKHLQTKQLDTHVRYWVGDTIETHYLDSQFMGHATAKDLKKHLKDSWETLSNKKGK